MHVITKKRLREFWELHPEAESSLRRWHKIAQDARWQSFADVRETYPHADQVDQFTVFNVGGNKYRLIAELNYRRGKIFIRHVLTHREYDRGKWKKE